jgi:hypothetical protein
MRIILLLHITRSSPTAGKAGKRYLKAKTELLMMEELGDQEGIDQGKIKGETATSENAQSINESGRTRHQHREQIIML